MGWQTQRRYLHFTLNSCHSHSASPFLYWIVISMVCIENYVCNEITNNSLNAKEYANYIAMLDLKAEAQVQWALSRRDVPEQTKWKQEKNMSSDRIIVLEAIKSKQQIFELRPDKASVYMFVYAPIHSNTRTLTALWTTFIQHTCSHTHTHFGVRCRWRNFSFSSLLLFLFLMFLSLQLWFWFTIFQKGSHFFLCTRSSVKSAVEPMRKLSASMPISHFQMLTHCSPCIDSGG